MGTTFALFASGVTGQPGALTRLLCGMRENLRDRGVQPGGIHNEKLGFPLRRSEARFVGSHGRERLLPDLNSNDSATSERPLMSFAAAEPNPRLPTQPRGADVEQATYR